MRIRSVTCFQTVSDAKSQAEEIRAAAALAHQARSDLESAGTVVQTVRLALQPLTQAPAYPRAFAVQLASLCADAGFDYVSLGPVLADAADSDLSLLDSIPEIITGTESVFASVLVARAGQGIHLGAIRRAACLVRDIAHSTDLGFGNLRLAVLANVGPHSPFFPAAYHDGGPPALALATESANLAVEVFEASGSLGEVRANLISRIEAEARRLQRVVEPLAARHDRRYVGTDFSLAPYPSDARSIGAAVEHLGVERFGAPGTLFAASLLTSCLQQAQFTRCGFNGLMLPVLEDTVLAGRSFEETFTVNDLLLYSAVCGTGLDTVPLPGDVSEGELAGILLDVAALAVRLNKPLTARLMPIPGAQAGDRTEFDFPYFANGRVLGVKGYGSRGILERSAWLPA